jgi:hypothetical protein
LLLVALDPPRNVDPPMAVPAPTVMNRRRVVSSFGLRTMFLGSPKPL